MYLIGMLVLLFLANVAMLLGMTNWPQRTREGFTANMMKSGARLNENMDNIAPYKGLHWGGGSLKQGAQFQIGSNPKTVHESFMNYMENGFGTAPIGSYDGLNLAANFPPASQGFRQKMPNVPLAGPAITIDSEHLLPFTNNECKPECCSSTLSCNGGGCICTTPEQRDFINTRGGNRKHDDGF
jgi:hypothetical protein